jgi:hypothetical protein
MKSRWMRELGQVACMEVRRNGYRAWEEKPEGKRKGKRSLVRQRHSQKNNSKMDTGLGKRNLRESERDHL